MSEVRLEADRMLTVGLLDRAEALYRRALDAEPRDASAVLGLARVALERGDEAEAHRLAREALAIDPDDSPARRLETRLAEILAARRDRAASAAARGAGGRAAAPGTAAPTDAPSEGVADEAPAALPLRRGWQPARMPPSTRTPGSGPARVDTPAPAGGPAPAGAGPPGSVEARPPRNVVRRILGR